MGLSIIIVIGHIGFICSGGFIIHLFHTDDIMYRFGRPARQWHLLQRKRCKYCGHRFGGTRLGGTLRFLAHQRSHQLWIIPYWYTKRPYTIDEWLWANKQEKLQRRVMERRQRIQNKINEV